MAELAKIRGEQIKETVLRDIHFDAANPINEDKVDIKWDEHLEPVYDAIESLEAKQDSTLAPFTFQLVTIAEDFTGEVTLDNAAKPNSVYMFVNGTVQAKETVTETVIPADDTQIENVKVVNIASDTLITGDTIQLFYTPIDPAKQGAEEPEPAEKATANITVKLPDGNFATGASVTLGQETKTVADQALVFESTVGEHNLSVTLAGYQDVTKQVTLTAETPLNEEINLVAQVYKLSGVVKDTDGQPIEGATVEAVLSV